MKHNKSATKAKFAEAKSKSNVQKIELGVPIKRKKANDMLKKHTDIRDAGNKILKVVYENDIDTSRLEFYKNIHNAFVFSRDDLKRFFKFVDDAQYPADMADYLMIILGAHDVNETVMGRPFKKGEPTVIIAGVKADESSVGLVSLPLTEPATEYPPKMVAIELPDTSTKGIRFTFVQ